MYAVTIDLESTNLLSGSFSLHSVLLDLTHSLSHFHIFKPSLSRPAGRGSTAMAVTTAGALRLLPKIERGLSFIRTDALRLP